MLGGFSISGLLMRDPNGKGARIVNDTENPQQESANTYRIPGQRLSLVHDDFLSTSVVIPREFFSIADSGLLGGRDHGQPGSK